MTQIVTMVWLFLPGLAALVASPAWPPPVRQIVGDVSIAVLDPVTARNAEVPMAFARLWPVQMAVPALALLLLV